MDIRRFQVNPWNTWICWWIPVCARKPRQIGCKTFHRKTYFTWFRELVSNLLSKTLVSNPLDINLYKQKFLMQKLWRILFCSIESFKNLDASFMTVLFLKIIFQTWIRYWVFRLLIIQYPVTLFFFNIVVKAPHVNN